MNLKFSRKSNHMHSFVKSWIIYKNIYKRQICTISLEIWKIFEITNNYRNNYQSNTKHMLICSKSDSDIKNL